MEKQRREKGGRGGEGLQREHVCFLFFPFLYFSFSEIPAGGKSAFPGKGPLPRSRQRALGNQPRNEMARVQIPAQPPGGTVPGDELPSG